MTTLTHHFKTTKTATIYSLGENTELTKEAWICLHGYGQRADFFAKNFQSLVAPERLIIVPEALNRFYLQGFSGRVGATWMTSYEREHEIADYVNYLNQVYEFYQLNRMSRVVCFSFSQGAATASRWLAQTPHAIHSWVIWAGTLAYDVQFESNASKFNHLHKMVCLGNNDPFFPAESKKQYLHQLNQAFNAYKLYEFDGGHEIHQPTLLQLSDTFDSI